MQVDRLDRLAVPELLDQRNRVPEEVADTWSAATPLRARRPRPPWWLYFGIVLVFLRFSMLHQLLSVTLGTNFYILYWIGIPAILGVLFSGPLKRILKVRAVKFWLCFSVWIVATIPFSFWPGGSFGVVEAFWKTELVMLFVIAGMAVTWRECRLIYLAVVAGTFTNLLTARLFGQEINNRLGVTVGTVANANDFAAHLLFTLPFLVWLILSSKNALVRVVAVPGIAYGVYRILASGSRGAAVALAIDILFVLWSAPKQRRFLLWASAATITIVAIAALPAATWQRILALAQNSSDAPQEAVESAENRKLLLEKSIEYTLRHPVFGIGPGQFSNYIGPSSSAERRDARWHAAHNSYLAVASEGGIPAFFFYMAAIVSTFGMLRRTATRVRRDPKQYRDLVPAVFALQLSFIGFCVAIFFLNFSYFFYLPAMTGLTIGISFVASQNETDIAPGSDKHKLEWGAVAE